MTRLTYGFRQLDVPFWMLEIGDRHGIEVVGRELSGATGGGLCAWYAGRPVVFVDPRRPRPVQMKILAHEFAHAFRGHKKYVDGAASQREEAACDAWGALLLALEQVPHRLGKS